MSVGYYSDQSVWSSYKVDTIVTVGSTYNSCEPVSPVRRWSKAEKKYIELDKPNTIDIYNKFMGGVDRADQMMLFYQNKLRVRKW